MSTTTALAYNLTEAVAVCGLGKDTLKSAIRRGELRAKKSGRDENGDPTGRLVILRDELERWLREDLPDA